jgi:outer membrane biosynthesis protein TonB
LPSQQGRDDLHSVDFNTQNYSSGKSRKPPAEEAKPPSPQTVNSGPVTKVKPQPTPESVPRETPSPAEQMSKLSDNLFALQKPTPAGKPQPSLQPTPPPAMKDMPRPKPEAGYQPQKQQTKIAGGISNRGRAGVNAMGTPLGRYQKLVGDAVGSRWYYYIGQRMDLITVGEARIRFCVNTSGRVEDVQILSNTSNQIFGEYCIQSIVRAELPPIPTDLAALLEDGKLDIEFSFTIYPN